MTTKQEERGFQMYQHEVPAILVRGQRSEVRNQKSEVRSQRSEVRLLKSDN